MAVEWKRHIFAAERPRLAARGATASARRSSSMPMTGKRMACRFQPSGRTIPARRLAFLNGVMAAVAPAFVGIAQAQAQTWESIPQLPPMAKAATSGCEPGGAVRIHFATYGAGRPQLLIHNGLGDDDEWSGALPFLTQAIESSWPIETLTRVGRSSTATPTVSRCPRSSTVRAQSSPRQPLRQAEFASGRRAEPVPRSGCRTDRP